MQTRTFDRTRVSDIRRHCLSRVVRRRALCSRRRRSTRASLWRRFNTTFLCPSHSFGLLMRFSLVAALAGVLAVDALKIPMRKLSRPHTSRKRALNPRAAAADTLDLSCVCLITLALL